MKYLVLLLFLLGTMNVSVAQVDYTAYAKKVPMSCTKNDSMSITKTQQILDSLSQYDIVNGKQLFQNHYAIMYSFRYWKWYDEEDMRKSMSYYEMNWEEFNDLESLSNLTGYVSIWECEKAIHYHELYVQKLTEQNMEVDYKDGYLLYRRCWENEQILKQ